MRENCRDAHRPPIRRLPVAVGLSIIVLAGSAAVGPAAAEVTVVGAPGVGDEYFPRAGNGGYDVSRYDLDLRYDPRTDVLRGDATIRAKAKQNLSRFNLDLRRPLRVRSVIVNGKRATFDRRGQELRITPDQRVGARDDLQVRVRYHGDPGQPVDVTGSYFGWFTTEDGAMVANEADGASTWFPANDHPTDKARFDFRITLPDGSSAIANGDFLGSEAADRGWTTWRWRQREPMTTYLATATIGEFEITTSVGPARIPIVNGIDRDLGEDADDGLVDTSRQLEFFVSVFGPYPFDSYGAIIDDDDIGYALETQNRPLYSGPPSSGLVAHEMAHQWFGNSVTLGRWKDLWLNEGFATYATWLWSEHEGEDTPEEIFDELYAMPENDPNWLTPPGDPGVENLFAGAVYWRGAMTLQAIRETVGDRDFFELLRTWASRFADSHATTPDLLELAESISGDQLDDLFEDWLYRSGKPEGWGSPGADALDEMAVERYLRGVPRS